MVADRDLILRPLRELGVRPEDVTDVVVSHHHLDHTVNIALFPVVPVHDFQSVIDGDTFTRRPAEGIQLTPSIRLMATPGHTPQDVTTLVGTADDVVARHTCGGRRRDRPTTPTAPIATSCDSSASGCSRSPASSCAPTARPSGRAPPRPAEGRARAGDRGPPRHTE